METKQLIISIKNGDERAFEELLNQHHNTIYKIIYGLNIQKGDYLVDIDSMFQEGSIALYKAVFTYKEENGMSFNSYAYMVIRARMHTYLRDAFKYLDKECFSIDNINNNDLDVLMKRCCVSDDPISYHREKEFENHLNKFMNNLNNEDKMIFKLRSEDYTYKQIAERLNIKTKKIDNRLRVLRNKLKQYIEEE